MGMNVPDKNAGFAGGQKQVWGFGKDTAIDSKVYGAPGSKIFYVDPNNPQATDGANGSNLGEDPTVPLATVAAAVALCRDHTGDTIVIGSNDAWQYSPHNRPLAVVESVVIPATKGGIRIVGSSTNPMGVQWEAAANAGTCITVNAIDVLIEGISFVESTYTGTTGIFAEWNAPTDYGENLTVRNCGFFSLDYGITMDYSWYNQIYSNQFQDIAIAAILNTSVTGDSDHNYIHDNAFSNCALSISMPTADYNFIYNNRIMGDPAGALNYINTAGGIANLVSDNWLGCSLAQYAVTCDSGATDAWVRNHCIDGDTVAIP